MTGDDDLQRRTSPRTHVLVTAILVSYRGPHEVLVRDISVSGAQVYAGGRVSVGEDVCFSRGALFVAAKIIWSRNGIAGLSFYRELSAEDIVEGFAPNILRPTVA